MRFILFFAFLLVVILGGCAQEGDPSETVESYLKAKVAADEDQMRQLACADWEGQVAIQADSLRGLDAKLEGLSCHQGEKDGDYTLVHCDGKLVATYNGEVREWELGSYRLIEEDGEWKVCGEG